MYFKLKCPHCEKSLKVSQELAGSKRACPYCKGTIRIPEQLAPEPAAPSEPAFPGIQITPTIGPKSGRGKGAGAKGSGEPKRKKQAHAGGSGATDTGDIPLIRSGLYGLAAAAVFLVLTLPVRHLGIFQLIWDRGPIPFATLLFTMWSFAILILKWRKLKQQREAMLLDVLPTELSREIGGEDQRIVTAPRSRFQNALRTVDPNKYYLRFEVGADSFDIYVTTRRIVSDMDLLAGWEPRSEGWTYTTHLGGEFRLGPKPPPPPPAPPKPDPPEPPKPKKPARVID